MADQPKRILYVQAPIGGGSTISLYELVKGIDSKRYVPVVLFMHENLYLDKFNSLRIQTLTLNRPGYGKKPSSSYLKKLFQLIFSDIPLAFYIAGLIKKERIDLVHDNFGFDRVIMMASSIARVPQVCHFRNFNEKIPLLPKLLIPSVDAAAYTTQAMAEHYAKLGGSVTRQAVVYEPIDIESFSNPQDARAIRRQFSVGGNDYLISNIGRITPWKGQHHFLGAIAETVKHYPNIKALIVGAPGKTDKDKQYLNSLQSLVEESSLQDHVIFTGNRNDIPEIMAASDIVVHSACLPEPFGLVIAEAMAAGTPVIATRGGGTPEIIEDGVTGILVAMNSPNGIQQAIQNLLASPELRARISAKAREVVGQRFSIAQHVAKIQNIYEGIFAES